MKAYQVTGKAKGEYIEVPIPVPGNDEVLVRIHYCGICGTDYALYSGNNSFVENGQVTYPIRIGHEWSGIVEAVGKDVNHVKPGDSVVGDNGVSCGHCSLCLAGRYYECEQLKCVGTIDPCYPGTFAEYFIVPKWHVYKIADSISLQNAALCEPLSVSYGGIRKMNINSDSIVAVIGTGCIGMGAAALAKQKGAGQVYLIGRNSYKLERAQQLEITGVIDSSKIDPKDELLRLTGGRYADFVIECSGNPKTISQSISLAAVRGTIALVGFYEKPIDGLNIDSLVLKELKLFGVVGEYGNIEAVSKIMAENDLHLGGIITDVITFDELDDALKEEDHSRIIKTMVKII